jgi:hypothetical protein
MTRKTWIILLILLLSAISTACKETSAPSISYDPVELSFSGKRLIFFVRNYTIEML